MSWSTRFVPHGAKRIAGALKAGIDICQYWRQHKDTPILYK